MVNSRNSNFRIMRLIVLYDLPSTTKKDMKEAALFRRQLMNRGFIMMQESVYVKQCINHDSLNRILIYVERILPSDGDIRTISITEKQYIDMKLLKGEKSITEKITEKGNLILI